MQQAEQSKSQNRPYSGFDFQLIGGTWRHGKAGTTAKDLNPFTREVFLEIPQADRDDLDQAYRSAREAQASWASRGPGERAGVMRRAASIMEARRDEIIDWLIREAGSTRIKAMLEWQAAHAVMLEATALSYQVEGRILPVDIPGKESRVLQKPVGVVGVISPWNFPFHLSARSVVPAMAVGNAVVLKPASDTPVSGGLLIAKIFEEAGVPPGILNVVIGAGKEIGDAFVAHPIPRVISFTGSTPVGRRIAQLAAQSPVIKRLELELGGNSPFVVLDDANLPSAVEAAVFGKFLHQGQICMAANRFVVHAAVHDDFVEAFVQRVSRLKVGDPEDPQTLIGPIINAKQLERLEKLIRQARESGLEQRLGGDPDGLVLPPHVFSGVDNAHPIAREELFGPVAPMIRVADEAEALEVANDTAYGLSGCVFTRDLERGARFAGAMETGMVHVNDQPVVDLPFNPFGGEKNSGIGRFNGRWAVAAFTTEQWLTVQHAPRSFPADARQLGGAWIGG